MGYIKNSFYYQGATRSTYSIYDGTHVWDLSRIIGAPEVEEFSVANRIFSAIKIMPSLFLMDPNMKPEWVAYGGKESYGDREEYFGSTLLTSLEIENAEFVDEWEADVFDTRILKK